MSVSIVMPCYNEEGIIKKVVKDYFNEVISKIEGAELVIIDDCSTDNTAGILKDLQKEYPDLKVIKTSVNSGHGLALRQGYEYAQGEWIFHVDSDNQFSPHDFWRLYHCKDNYDFILGFREQRNDPFVRLVLSRIIRVVNFIFFGVWIKDANCPFRLIRKTNLQEFLSVIDKNALAPNIMISLLARKKIRMVEVPVAHYQRKTGVNWLSYGKLIRFAFKGFIQLIKFRKAVPK